MEKEVYDDVRSEELRPCGQSKQPRRLRNGHTIGPNSTKAGATKPFIFTTVPGRVAGSTSVSIRHLDSCLILVVYHNSRMEIAYMPLRYVVSFTASSCIGLVAIKESKHGYSLTFSHKKQSSIHFRSHCSFIC